MSRIVYEYVFDITFNVVSRNIKFKPYSMVSFSKHCDYFNNFIPSYELVCKISDKYVNILRLFDKEITVFIKKYRKSGASRDKYTQSDIVSEQEFAVYYDKEDIPNYMNTEKKVSPELVSWDKYKADSPGTLAQHEIKFNLLLKNDLKMKTMIHNYVLGSDDSPCSPIDAAVFVIEQNPYVKKCIIDAPDNTAEYPDLIVEAGELKDALKNIQFNYGIYSKGLELFFDDEILYVLNKCENGHSVQKDEINVISIKIHERTDVPEAKEYVNEDKKNKKIYYERRSKLYKEDYESIEGILNGDKFVYSNYGSVINSMFSQDGKGTFLSPLAEVDKPRPSRVDIGTKKILDYDMLNNNFNMSSYMHERSIGVPISFSLEGINTEHFRPNMMISITTDTPESNKLYKGIYSIKNADFIYVVPQTPGKFFNAYASGVLTLCNKIEGYDKEYEPQNA